MTYIVRRRPGMGDFMTDATTFWSGGDNTDLVDFMTGPSAITADAAPASDNVNQTATGTTTTAADFTVVGGVCKPMNFPALATVRAFQLQLNRVAQAKGFSKIATDGAVGPATMALFRKVQAAAPSGQIMGDATACINISADVDVLGQQIQTFADALGAPATVSAAPSLSPPTITTKSGAMVVAPDAGILGSLATLSGAEKLALLGVAGGLGYMLLKKKPRTQTVRYARTSRRR